MQFVFDNSRREQRFSFNKVLPQRKAQRKSPSYTGPPWDRATMGFHGTPGHHGIPWYTGPPWDGVPWNSMVALCTMVSPRDTIEHLAPDRSGDPSATSCESPAQRRFGASGNQTDQASDRRPGPIRDQGRLKTPKINKRPGTSIWHTRVIGLDLEAARMDFRATLFTGRVHWGPGTVPKWTKPQHMGRLVPRKRHLSGSLTQHVVS